MARTITKADILPAEVYARERDQRRKAILPLKRARRVEVGPFATFYFENFETMFQQIHEMLHIEKGGEDQIADELAAYNPLIPQGDELIATLMLEIDDPVRRAEVLRQLTFIERTVYLEIGGERIGAESETEVDRTKDDGKTSSIHFLRFRLTAAQIAKFKEAAVPVVLGIGHENYGHMASMPAAARAALVKDLA